MTVNDLKKKLEILESRGFGNTEIYIVTDGDCGVTDLLSQLDEVSIEGPEHVIVLGCTPIGEDSLELEGPIEHI